MATELTKGSIQQDKYVVERLIGRGCAGSVYEVSRLGDNQKFALKSIHAGNLDDMAVRQAFREVDIMKRVQLSKGLGIELTFPWIVPIYEFWVDEIDHCNLNVCMVMELVSGPSLEAHLERLSHPRMKRRSNGGFSRKRPGEELSDDDNAIISVDSQMIYSWVSQIVLALCAIHKLHIVHRDIKPANLILSEDLREIKLADFSISKVLDPNEPYLETIAGTIQYTGPEVLQGKVYTETCDMWSLGCVVYEMLTLTKVFKVANTSRILSTINRHEIPSVPDDNDPGLVMLCNRLLNPDPTRRPSAMSLCKHPRLRPFVAEQLARISPEGRRFEIIRFLELESLVTTSPSPNISSHKEVQDDLVVVDEINIDQGVPIEEQFDDDIGVEVVPLLQGSWIVAQSSPQVQVSIQGTTAIFSDGRPSETLRRATRREERDTIEWILGQNLILMKSVSCFISPQKLLFARIQGGPVKRHWSVKEACLVLTREDSIHTAYHSTASTMSG